MYSFDEWASEIAAVTTLPEFQNATVTLIDPTVEGEGIEYDFESGDWVEEPDAGVIGTTRARLISIRWGVNRENKEVANSSTLKAVRVQFPNDVDFILTRIRRGTVLRVDESPNPTLVSGRFVCMSDLQGSHMASRTVEFEWNSDVVLEDTSS